MARLRIGYFLAGHPAGGIATHVLSLVDHFRADHDVSVFSEFTGDEPFLKALKARGLATHTVAPLIMGRHGIWKPILAGLPVVFAGRSLLARERLDVIHFHAGRLGILYPPILAGRLAGIPVRVLTLHNPVRKRSPLHRLIEGRVLGDLEQIIVVSHEVKDYLVSRKKAPAEKIIVIPNGVEAAEFAGAVDPGEARRALGVADDGPVVGMVSRLGREKGADLLIRAVARIGARWPRLWLVLIGAGPEMPELRRLAEEEGVAERVVFAGFRDDARRLIHGLDVVVLPSRRDAQPYSLLEAMACAKPVVAARVGGIPGMMADGVTGLLFPSEDVGALADALASLLGDAQKRARMGAAGRQRVETQFSQRAMLEKTAAIYRGEAP
jgi:glycosyltransferase involved in cell wall biosynthesis